MQSPAVHSNSSAGLIFALEYLDPSDRGVGSGNILQTGWLPIEVQKQHVFTKTPGHLRVQMCVHLKMNFQMEVLKG